MMKQGFLLIAAPAPADVHPWGFSFQAEIKMLLPWCIHAIVCNDTHFVIFTQQNMLDPPSHKIFFPEMLEITLCNVVSFYLHKDIISNQVLPQDP